MINIYLGIDNGLDGGIVALSSHGLIIDKWRMPTKAVVQPARKTTKEKKLREVCSESVLDIIDYLGNRENMVVYFEHCPYRAERASTMRSMAMSAGKILAVMETRGVTCHRVLNYDWQPAILGKVPQGKTKEYALRAAKSRWEDESWLATKRSTVPHDGMIDAALIAEYGRRQCE